MGRSHFVHSVLTKLKELKIGPVLLFNLFLSFILSQFGVTILLLIISMGRPGYTV